MFSLFSSNERAFSLLEVLITAAIIGIVTAIVVVRYGAFNNSVLLKSQAYELALDLREAQVFAISVRGSGSQFREEYGLYFDSNQKNQYLLFLDSGTSVPARYNTSPVDEQVGDTYIIDARFEIADICVNNNCSQNVNNVAISFQRPDFDAQFATSPNESSFGGVNQVEIVLQSVGSSETRSVLITSTGQITVQ